MKSPTDKIIKIWNAGLFDESQTPVWKAEVKKIEDKCNLGHLHWNIKEFVSEDLDILKKQIKEYING